MMGGAKGYFGLIQGGEARASPKRAVSAEPTPESVKMARAPRVAAAQRALAGVVSTSQARCRGLTCLYALAKTLWRLQQHPS